MRVSCAWHARGMHVACTEGIASSPVVSALTPPYQVISRLYQSDDAALQALRQNSQILLPVYSSPTLLQDSYDGLLAAMGPASRVDMRLQPRTPCELQASRHRSAGSSNTALHTVHAAAGHSTQYKFGLQPHALLWLLAAWPRDLC